MLSPTLVSKCFERPIASTFQLKDISCVLQELRADVSLLSECALKGEKPADFTNIRVPLVSFAQLLTKLRGNVSMRWNEHSLVNTQEWYVPSMFWETLFLPDISGHRDSLVPETGNPEFFILLKFKFIH